MRDRRRRAVKRRILMKKNFGGKNWMFPMPVLMVGTYGDDGTPDVMNAAWGGITLEDEITICIDTAHRTWANIAARKAFTVAFGTADTVASCDYLGLVSGNKTPDKVAKSGFTVAKSAFVDAPVVNELPLVLECTLVSMDETDCNVVGKIVNCAVEESALTDGLPDAAKMKPLCYDACAHVYRVMGAVAGKAFSDGKKLVSR
jgi:flavin reductase (DIM6/NTAB) family NADH-FMN oxidoreductase RutF